MADSRLALRYGLNPHQPGAFAAAAGGGPSPLTALAGTPSVLNLLDALQGWQLVRAASTALGTFAAASMKHVSPAGAALAGPVDGLTPGLPGRGETLSPAASAYARARDCDPRSSYGDMAVFSGPVDLSAARLLSRVVSDGVIAPDYQPGTTEILARKKKGAFVVLRVDPGYEPPAQETREVFGVRITQDRDRLVLDRGCLGDTSRLSAGQVADALLGLITVRHTQSNSVACVHGGRTIGIGAGQQSRVDCVRLAGEKADRHRLLHHPRPADEAFAPGLRVQDRIGLLIRLAEELSPGERRDRLAAQPRATLVSDAYLPFRDNVDVAAQHGIGVLVEGGGSRRGPEIEEACRQHDITLVRTGLRLFAH